MWSVYSKLSIWDFAVKFKWDSKLITTFVRYHFYYQIRKFIHHPELIDQYETKEVREHIPIVYKDEESVGTDDDGNRYIS